MICHNGLQLSPVMSTGNTGEVVSKYEALESAAIEPGHVDREHRRAARAGSVCRRRCN